MKIIAAVEGREFLVTGAAGRNATIRRDGKTVKLPISSSYRFEYDGEYAEGQVALIDRKVSGNSMAVKSLEGVSLGNSIELSPVTCTFTVTLEATSELKDCFVVAVVSGRSKRLLFKDLGTLKAGNRRKVKFRATGIFYFEAGMISFKPIVFSEGREVPSR